MDWRLAPSEVCAASRPPGGAGSGSRVSVQGERLPVVGRGRGSNLLGENGHLGAVAHVELAHQRCHVRFDRGLGDAEVEGDLLVRQSEMDPAQYAQLSRGKSLDTGRDRTGARQPGRGRQPVRKRLVRLVFVHLSPPQTWWLQAAFGVGHCLELHTIRNTTCPTSSSPIRQVCAGFAQVATICVFSVTQVRANVYTKAAPLTVRGRGTQPNELGGDSP